MFRIIAAAAALLLPTAAFAQASATPPAPPPAPIEVLVLGVYHMNNPGRDVNNARVDPVTTPEKQAQLAEVAQALARFQPTAIAIERVAPDPSTMLDAGWPSYDPAILSVDNNERVQIGYRLAALANVQRVYAVDEQDREGQPPYFPYGDLVAWANANGKADVLAGMNGEVRAMLGRLEAEQRTKSVGQLLAFVNTPEMARWNGSNYYRFLQFGGGDVLPGAELNGRWYTRNAMIFAKLMQVAKPGDRIVLMFGSGHAYWLRHFVETTPGFKLVEATDYLPPA